MSGFDNEAQIINTINSIVFDELSKDLRSALIMINDGCLPQRISAKKYGGTDKADLSITIDDKEYFISVKKGTGNSVHQERIEDFIEFLKKNFENDYSVFNDLRHFIWGDGTLTGNGRVEDRIGAVEYKQLFPVKVKNIQSYFNRHKNELLERFLITGAISNQNPDYLLYGSINECIVVSSKEVLNYACNVNKSPLSIGVLTFQAWNRNINGGNKSEHKRGQIQLKWGLLRDDIKKI